MARSRHKRAWFVVCLSTFLFLSLTPLFHPAKAEAQNVLKFGSLAPLMFKEGVEIKKWHDPFAKMINEKGGLLIGGKKYLVRFYTYDVGYMDSARTLAAVQYGGGEAMTGLKMYPPIFFGLDTVDYGPIATKIKSLGPDFIDFGVAAGDQVVNLVSALKDAGWKGFIFPGAGINPTTFANIIKRVGSYFDGAEMLFTGPRGIPVVANDPEMKALIDRYIKEYGEFRTEGCLWLTGWFTVKAAMMAARSVDTTVLKDFLAKGTLTPLTMSGYCALFARPEINQLRSVDGCTGAGRGVVRSGKLEYVGQLTPKDNYIATIKLHKLQDVYQKYWDQNGKPRFPPEKSTLDFSDLTK